MSLTKGFLSGAAVTGGCIAFCSGVESLASALGAGQAQFEHPGVLGGLAIGTMFNVMGAIASATPGEGYGEMKPSTVLGFSLAAVASFGGNVVGTYEWHIDEDARASSEATYVQDYEQQDQKFSLVKDDKGRIAAIVMAAQPS